MGSSMPHGTGAMVLDDLRVDVRHIVLAVGRAVNYGGTHGHDHPFRTAYIAQQCAADLGWDDTRQQFVHMAGVLHTCGAPSAPDAAAGNGACPDQAAETMCGRGYEYLSQSELLRDYAQTVRHAHTGWKQLEETTVDPDDMTAPNLLNVAGTFDRYLQAFAADNPAAPVSDGALPALERILGEAGERYCRTFVSALSNVIHKPDFWIHLNGSELQNLTGNLGDKNDYVQVTNAGEAARVARLIARLVDGKSAFTVAHSERVAAICQELARELGFSPRAQSEVYLAGLLHDIGYVDTPSAVTLKAGKLDPDEFSIVKQHVKNLRPMLQRCFPGSRIPEWAANHHERLDGNGYPNHLKGNELDPGSRVVAIADIFQALSQKRPYRNSKSAADIVRIMRAMVRDQQLDSDIFDLLARRPEHYYALATGAAH